jgi:mono/diheme cytochrome c family protein
LKEKIKNILERLKQVNENLLKPESRSGKLHSIAASFETPDEIVRAANETAAKGYREFDVFTPYPVHGMDDAMKLRPTRVGWVSFTFGFIGTSSALLMIGWMMGVDYKNIIGGKPFFNIPPSIPITFELTVLLAAIATVLGMLILFNKLPAIHNPLHDTEFMKRVSSDRFGIIIEAKDKKFNENEVKQFFQSLGSKDVESIYYPAVDVDKPKTPIFSKEFMTTIGVTIVVVAIGSYFTLNWLLYDVVPFDWMWKQDKVLPQTRSIFFTDGFSMRTPVEGTVARGFIPYEYRGMPDSLIKVFYVNPLPVTKDIIEHGKKRFDTYCSPCHGYLAKGDSRLHGQFPAPPTLHSDKVRNWEDGRIYNVITNGQNTMPSYEKQIARDDRWAIIHYLRVLQRSQNARETDLPGADTTKK